MRRAFSDLIIQSYSPEEIEALSWTVVSAMLPEHDDGRQVMDDDPATLSDWNYESPKPPKTSLIRKPTPPAIMPPPPWPANFSDPENYDPDE